MAQGKVLIVEQSPLAGNGNGFNALEVPFSGLVAAVSYIPVAAMAGAAAPNSRTLRLISRGQDGSLERSVASLPLVGGVNIAAFDERVIPLNFAWALVVAEGEVLEWRSEASSNPGLIDPGGTVQVHFLRS